MAAATWSFVLPVLNSQNLAGGGQLATIMLAMLLIIPFSALTVYAGLSSHHRPALLHFATTGFLATALVGVATAGMLLGGNPREFLLIHILTVFLTYIIIPNRMLLRLLVGVIATFAFGFSSSSLVGTFGQPSFIPISLSIAANVFGFAIGSWLTRRLRIEFRDKRDAIETRARTENRLRSLETKLRETVEHLTDTLYRADRDGNIEYISPSVFTLTGYTQEEVIGNPLSDFYMHPEDRGKFLEALSEAGGELSGFETELRNKSGESLWVATSAKVVYDENGVFDGVEGTTRDVTEHRNLRLELLDYKSQLEEKVQQQTAELLESQNKLSQLIENTQEGFWYIDNNGKTVDVNPALCAMLGEEKEALLGKNIYDFVDDENKKIFKDQLELRKKGIHGAYEISLRHADGHNVHCINNPTPIFDTSGNRVGSIGLWTDISQLKETQSNLEKAKRDADVANQAKSSFLANMSHEIRTPMNGVIGMAEILMRTGLNDEQSRQAELIVNSSRSLLRIIDDILDMSKIEAGKLQLDYIDFKLKELLESIAVTHQPTSDHANVRLYLSFGVDLPERINLDPFRLRQIIANLLGNAIKFSGRKEGKERGRVVLSADILESGVLRIVVSDNGIGMSEEAVRNLFQPFSQAESSTTRRFGGSGLGLSITKSLVEMMNGRIEVTSTLGEGARFTVDLPCKVLEQKHTAFLSNLPPFFGLFDDELAAEVRMALERQYGAAGNGKLCDSIEELQAEIDKTEGPVFIVLGVGDLKDNLKVVETISSKGGRVKYICQTGKRSDPMGEVRPGVFSVSRFPSLPSEIAHALSVLMGTEDPKDSTSQTDEPQSAEKDGSKTGRVLLVEDNEINQEVISAQLKMLGYDVEIAGDGVIGLDKWRSESFDVVLSDCHMPNMDGFEFTAQVRAEEKQKGLPRTPVVAITANALKGEAERCLAAQMDDYLSKPLGLQALGDKLEKWVHSAGKETNA